MSETTLEMIMRKTGTKLSECKCESCKSQCRRCPGLGTPEDIGKLIAAGYEDRLALTTWLTGMEMKVTNQPVDMAQPLYDKKRGCCTFFTDDGLCELHSKGLKPTECRLSNHAATGTNFIPRKSISWNIAKLWVAENLKV